MGHGSIQAAAGKPLPFYLGKDWLYRAERSGALFGTGGVLLELGEISNAE